MDESKLTPIADISIGESLEYEDIWNLTRSDIELYILMRKARDVITRRGWGVARDVDGWYPTHSTPVGVHCIRELAKRDIDTWPDPFTALVEADAWMTAQESKESADVG